MKKATLQQAVRSAIDLIYSDNAILSVEIEFETNGRLFRGVYHARRQANGDIYEHFLGDVKLA